MAEVAVFISTTPEQAIAGAEKGEPPKNALLAKGARSGAAQKMRGTVVHPDGAQTVG